MGSRIIRIAAIAAMVATLFGAARADAATTPSPTALSAGEVVVDEVGGHVFVTATDSVAVFDLAGNRTGTIAGQLGAADLELHGRTLYVLAAGANRVNTVDADTFAVTGGWNLPGMTAATSFAVVAGRIWITYDSDRYYGLASLDPTTGVVQSGLAFIYDGSDVVGTDSPARLYVLHRGMSPSKVQAFDVSTGNPVLLDTSPHTNDCANGSEIALAPSGVDLWTACGSPYRFTRWDRTALGAPTLVYPAVAYPAAVTVSADGQVLVGATSTATTGPDIRLYDAATATLVKALELGPSKVLAGMLGTTSDGSRVYAVTADGALRAFDLRPTITARPTSVLAGAAASVTVTGSGLADVTSVDLGGQATTFTVVSDTTLQVTVPALDGGTYPLTLTSRWGTSATSDLAQVVVDVPRVPDAPAAPAVTGSPAFGVSLEWSAPAVDSRTPVTSYLVRTYLGDAATPSTEQTVTGTNVTVDGLMAETGYRFSVAAVNAVGAGAFSTPTDLVIAGSPDIAPFDSFTSLVNRQYRDVVGRAPTNNERNLWLAGLRSGGVTAVDLVSSLRASDDNRLNVDAVARLYLAYFGRPANTSGLTYWTGKRRGGTSLGSISDNFASSTEFRRTYSSLSNRRFVELVYQRVLGRSGDAGGVDFWTKQIDTRRKTRGMVMVGFSESNEYVRSEASEVNASVVPTLLLGHAPTRVAYQATVDDLDASATNEGLIASILTSPEYAERIAG